MKMKGAGDEGLEESSRADIGIKPVCTILRNDMMI
jgi:hypothetical protein